MQRTARDGTGGSGPGGRIGHSMVLAVNDSRVIMFGGRDNEVIRQHIPRTYEVRDACLYGCTTARCMMFSCIRQYITWYSFVQQYTPCAMMPRRSRLDHEFSALMTRGPSNKHFFLSFRRVRFIALSTTNRPLNHSSDVTVTEWSSA